MVGTEDGTEYDNRPFEKTQSGRTSKYQRERFSGRDGTTSDQTKPQTFPVDDTESVESAVQPYLFSPSKAQRAVLAKADFLDLTAGIYPSASPPKSDSAPYLSTLISPLTFSLRLPCYLSLEATKIFSQVLHRSAFFTSHRVRTLRSVVIGTRSMTKTKTITNHISSKAKSDHDCLYYRLNRSSRPRKRA